MSTSLTGRRPAALSVHPAAAVSVVDDHRQALYREAQVALRAAIGARELDALLQGKEAVARELLELVRARAADFGVEVIALGIRDIILPGEMKDLMNWVTEARKTAEANLVTRREEVAAVRSQANTARLPLR
jgi:regulator of protease activity HflC (stomatin/prohibitin superfamily)